MQYRHAIREKPPLSSAKEEAIMIVPTIKPDGSFDKEENNIDSLKFRPMMSLPSLMTMNTIWKFASAPSA